MTPDDNYFLCNSDNLPIQRQFSKKQKNNFQFLAQFLKSTRKFEQFVKMTTLIAYLFPKLNTLKELVRPISKKPG